MDVYITELDTEQTLQSTMHKEEQHSMNDLSVFTIHDLG